MSVLALSGHAAPPPDVVEGGKAEWRDGPPCRLMTQSGHGPASHVSVAKPVSAPTKVLVRAATMPCPEPRGMQWHGAAKQVTNQFKRDAVSR